MSDEGDIGIQLNSSLHELDHKVQKAIEENQGILQNLNVMMNNKEISRLHQQLKTAVSSSSGLLEALQPVSDIVQKYEREVSRKLTTLDYPQDLTEARRRLDQEREEWEKEVEIQRKELKNAYREVEEARSSINTIGRELAAQRIALEEERLSKINGTIQILRESDSEKLQYHLKQQMLKNVKLEKEKIKVDFKLQEKIEALKIANVTIQRLDSEVIQSRESTEKIVKQFERQTVEANKRLAEMQQELEKAKERALRFQKMLKSEKLKQMALEAALEKEIRLREASITGPELSPRMEKMYISTVKDTVDQIAPVTILGTTTDANEIKKRSQHLLYDQAFLRAKLRQYEFENSIHLKKIREINAEKEHLEAQLVIMHDGRLELKKKFEKLANEHRRLLSTVSRQRTDWFQKHRQEQQQIEEAKWSKIGPMPLINSRLRTQFSSER
ncbi:hypothetical protein TrispH2_001001 [Trichoplax sp. H2]|nr:hypothetical protein TrispH2_001001 [Trichoplax sp. H2]|eukprot:RDD46690.1 hypothetical protein TrispH2_001001 [Trichoplax sp. H2]